MSKQPLITVVAPVRNEEDNLNELHQRLASVLAPISPDYEIIFVDDGSEDGSVRAVETLMALDRRIRLVELSRNFGKEMAMLAGYDSARGRATIVIDADLQTPPEVIGEMVEKWRGGAEIVDAVRRATIGQGPLRRLCSRAFYGLITRLTKTPIIPNAVDFRLLDEKPLRELRRCRERLRFNRGLVGWIGFRRATVTFVAPPRRAGATRWGGLQLIGYAMDAIFSFSSFPLRLAGLMGLLVSLLSFLYMIWLVADNLRRGLPIPGYATLACGIFLLGGMTLLGIWLLGEYIGRLYDEAKGRPPYITRRIVGGDDPAEGPEAGPDSPQPFSPKEP